MKYDFDRVVDRTGTDAVKIEDMKNIWGRTDLIPLWVADMDLETAPFITEAIKKRCENGILGYTIKSDDYYNSIIKWISTRYELVVDKEMITFVPGIVPGIGMAINCFSKKGDKIMIQPPVYHPFRWIAERNDRTVVVNPLLLENGRYRMDIDAFRKDVKGCSMFILCNPHNPGGVVWKKEELEAIANICYEEKVLVISDEIHADLTLPPHKHLSFATVSNKARMNSITFMSPSKAFNMPGLAASHAIIFNVELLTKFRKFVDAGELDMGHVFAFLSVQAAYSNGTDWLDQCIAYIQGNINYVDDYLKNNVPKIKAMPPQASYLIWLDCREMNLSQKELNEFFVDGAHLALNDGTIFGSEGEGFMRLNAACPRSVLEKAMLQLLEAYKRANF